jgi:hypothetical protein
MGSSQPGFLAARGGMPYEAFERLPISKFRVGGGTIEVAVAPGEIELGRQPLLDWIAAAGRAVAAYYGRFPVSRVQVLVIPAAGRGIGSGTTFGYRGAAIKVAVGRETLAEDLGRDWVMTHEMVHLAFPDVADEHEWIEEGIATYVEPLGRVQAGQLPVEKVWADLVWGLPKGLPQSGDHGLDHTPTWGRTYWGGALFCLLADIEIHERTQNRRGLQDALRAIVAAGGNVEVHWPLERTLELGDRATGVPVLRELYDRMKATPVQVDLPLLWSRLGVKAEGPTILFDDGAPLAHIRRTITIGSSVRDDPPRS